MDNELLKSSTASFNDEPLDSLLDKKVHEMQPEELVEYIKWMATLRSSAQSRKAALRGETSGEKKPTKAKAPKKDSATLAMELLLKIQSQKK